MASRLDIVELFLRYELFCHRGSNGLLDNGAPALALILRGTL